MTGFWLDALAEVDESLAKVLAVHETTAASPPPTSPEEAETLALGWMADTVPMPNMLIFAGVSQVDLLEPLLQRKEFIRILLVETDSVAMVAALKGVDSPVLADAIRSQRLLLDLGESEEHAIERFLLAADFSRVPVIRLMEARPLSDADVARAVEMTRAAREFIRLQACDMSTRNRFGPVWQMNTLRNVPRILQQGRIRSLFGKFSTIPAVVVSAGPSLKDVIPALARIRHRVVVIAVGRVMSTLIHRMGIVPDLVVTGDGQDFVVNHFKKKPAGLPVVASCFTDTKLVQELDRVFFAEMMGMELPKWMESVFGSVGQIHPGGNVTTAAISTAVEMGCSPVMTAGFDLSYRDDGVTHVTGTLKKDGVRLYDVTGNYQPVVKTNRQMWHYIKFAQEYIEEHPEVSYININTGGAHIEGMRVIRPEEIEAYIPTKPVNAAMRIQRLFEGGHAEVHPVDCAKRMRDDVQRLQSLASECMGAAMVSNRLIMLMRCPMLSPDAEGELYQLIDDLKPVDERIKEDPVMTLISPRLEAVSRNLAERMMTVEERAQSPALRSHRRWREFYKGVAQACRATEKLLLEAIRRVEEDIAAQGKIEKAELNAKPEKGEQV